MTIQSSDWNSRLTNEIVRLCESLRPIFAQQIVENPLVDDQDHAGLALLNGKAQEVHEVLGLRRHKGAQATLYLAVAVGLLLGQYGAAVGVFSQYK